MERKISYPSKNYHLIQATNNTYSNKLFKLLETVIKFLYFNVKHYELIKLILRQPFAIFQTKMQTYYSSLMKKDG